MTALTTDRQKSRALSNKLDSCPLKSIMYHCMKAQGEIENIEIYQHILTCKVEHTYLGNVFKNDMKLHCPPNMSYHDICSRCNISCSCAERFRNASSRKHKCDWPPQRPYNNTPRSLNKVFEGNFLQETVNRQEAITHSQKWLRTSSL